MSHLRLVHSPPPPITADAACLDAFQREVDYINRTLRRLGVSFAEVDDLTQDVFLALRRSWSEYDATRPLRPYLFGISFRIASAYQRKRRREVAFGLVDIGDGRPGPEAELQVKQSRRLVLAALERIPLPRRAVLIMHEIDEVPVREVAAALAIPLFTAYSRLRKARRELKTAVRRISREVAGE